MRFQPQNGEFEKLDELTEKSIKSSSGKLYHQLNDLVSLSYFGMLEIAKTNSIDCIDQTLQVTSTLITATVGIHNPKTGWTGYGASQCKNSLSNQAQNVAVKKAFRNAVRLSLPPWYLRECLKQLLNNRGLSASPHNLLTIWEDKMSKETVFDVSIGGFGYEILYRCKSLSFTETSIILKQIRFGFWK